MLANDGGVILRQGEFVGGNKMEIQMRNFLDPFCMDNVKILII